MPVHDCQDTSCMECTQQTTESGSCKRRRHEHCPDGTIHQHTFTDTVIRQ